MEVNVEQHAEKLKILLNNFLERDFRVADADLNVFLTHLSGKDNQDFGTSLLNLPLFSEWVVHACAHWETNAFQPTSNIGRFTLELIALLSKDEDRFAYLNHADVYVRLTYILNIGKSDCSPSIKVAFVKMLSSFLSHQSGIEWQMSSYFWKDVLSYCLTNSTLYLLRESNAFMYDLLFRSRLHNLAFTNSVVSEIMKPLVVNNLKTNEREVNDEELRKKLTPTLRLIIFLLEQSFKNDCILQRNPQVMSIFLKNHHLESVICSYMMIARDPGFFFDLCNLSCLINLIKLCLTAENDQLKMKETTDSCIKVFSIVVENINKKHITNVIKLAHLINYYWSIVGPRQPEVEKEADKEPILMENQLIIIQILPLIIVGMQGAKVNKINIEISENMENEDAFRESFICKIFKIMCHYTIRIGYNWRNVLVSEENYFKYAHKALFYLMQSRKYYTRDQAITVFQSLVYLFKDIVTGLGEVPEFKLVMVKEGHFVFSLLDAISSFIAEFDITWKDCLESMCISAITIAYLKVSEATPKLVVQALKLLKMTIEKYMTPNMVLLIDQTKDSALEQMGPLLKTKLTDEHWEIRDTALEMITTMSQLARNKFPSYQRVILNQNYPELVVTLCLTDTESFVRASAIKCITEMLKVEAFWCDNLDKQDLHTKLIQTVMEESEAIVRTEATTLMYEMYRCRSFPEDVINQFYETMAYAATIDLHWEVKLRALHFWNTVIGNSLQQQGVIDGSFPTVTFSKEHKKIVTLTDAEIKRRLVKVLEQLSSCGCLAVLVSAIQDDCDVEVVKSAVQVTKRLVDFLDRYSLNTVGGGKHERSWSLSSAGSERTYSSSNSSPPVSKVSFDELLGVSSCCASSSGASVSSGTGSVKVVSPGEFLNFVKQDLEEITASRLKWLSSLHTFGSLLDDMLKCYDNDVNSMDCY